MIRRLAASLLVKLAKRKEGRPPYAFHDSQGRAYYAWKDLSEMPLARRQEVDTIMLWIDAGRPQNALSEIAGAIQGRVQNALKSKNDKERSPHLAAINNLASEMLMREALVPEENYYALAAATCVREDEGDPAKIDRHIHQQKIEAFRLAGRAGHTFFTTPIQSALLGPLYTTADAWPTLLQGWINQAARHKAAMTVLS